MIGKLNSSITVQQLYDYALNHNMLGADYKAVLDIMSRERNSVGKDTSINIPTHNTSTIDFNTLVEYSPEDLLTLLSL